MDALTWTINIGALVVVTLGIYKYWVLAKGANYLRRSYWLTIAIGTVNFLVNTFIVVRDPVVWGLLSFHVVIVWSIIMSIKGLLYADVSSR